MASLAARKTLLVLESVPSELRSRPHWVVWRRKRRDGKWTKVPYNAKTGRKASSTDATTWTSFERAVTALQGGGYDGVGFVFMAGDGIVGVDLDHCRNPSTAEIEPWASDVIDRLATYWEVSPSGEGLHAFVLGELPPGGRKKGPIEMYDSGRYFTVTGAHLEGTDVEVRERGQQLCELHEELLGSRPQLAIVRPTTPGAALPLMEDDELLAHVRSAKNADKFERLWGGDDDGYPSRSEADLALLGILAFYTDDPKQMDRLFRQSDRFGKRADKWDERHREDGATYGELSIEKVLDPTRRRYSGCATDFANTANITTPFTQIIWPDPIAFNTFNLPPFPVHTLPCWAREWVDAVAEATQTPSDLSAMLALSVTAAALAKKVEVEVNASWREPINIFTLTVLPSGNRKSAVFRSAVAPLEEFEQEEAKRLDAVISEANYKKKRLEKELSRTERELAKADDDEARRQIHEKLDSLHNDIEEIVVPQKPRLIVDDCSPERLVTLMQQHGGRMAVLSAEGDIFDIIGGRYNRGQPNIGAFLKAHAGDAIRVDRVQREYDLVRQPALTIGLTVQPDVLESLLDHPGFKGRGLLARFLYAVPESIVGRRKIAAAAVPGAVTRAYCERVTELAVYRHHALADGEEPLAVTMSSGAVELLNELQAWLEPQLGEYGRYSHMSEWGCKLAGAVTRIAGLLHMGQGNPVAAGSRPIDEDTMERAITIGKYLLAHAEAAHGQMGVDEATRDAQYLAGWIAEHRRSLFTEREAFEATKGTLKRMARLRDALRALVERHYARPLPEEGHRGPGRPKGPRYAVNKALLDGGQAVAIFAEFAKPAER